ncbi:MmoB/DmpM family protein [Neptuniibacter pectenicola]|jgi:phenol hydroxylase P2 protein|uniref:MmoB/DmpM family protein n=1 Tax=Neptuniibacter pectenicola TaxID=1806669 RepID=A0ABU9TVB6_9GAMM|nr:MULTISPECIES: MmoB/DmpM family protein [Neptuniibacter]KXJ57610.1 MAG: monooxygenase [Neptuniibacter sp. Phe_28]MDO6513299.1 MmoB/DmpM family protein [Neptuniibacter sp. 2_MG-2023]MDO6595038.1 MmoB/DmpM family protein [Neptuniibacter sp. 1_MG-2023]
MSKVYIALQDNDESRYIVEAIEEDNPEATVIHMPAMIRIEMDGRLTVLRETVEEKMGRDWDIQELHLNLITLGGNVEEDDDSLSLHWNE